jgi:sugar lactone lactonase YvrE
VVADGIPWRDDKAALAIGPTGVALGTNGTLYVADTLENRIIAIPNAMTRSTPLFDKGITLTSGGHLNQPLGLTLAPNGDILTTNAGDGNILETTPSGQQIATVGGDAKAGAGSLFGLAIAPGGRTLAYVDDASNTVRLRH